MLFSDMFTNQDVFLFEEKFVSAHGACAASHIFMENFEKSYQLIGKFLPVSVRLSFYSLWVANKVSSKSKSEAELKNFEGVAKN